MKILDRYIITEIGRPLCAGIAVFVILFLSADHFFRIARMVVEKAQIMMAVEFLLSSLPRSLVLMLPMAVMLACLLAFSRLSADFELIALRTGGISFYRIALPGMVLTLLLSIGAIVFNEMVVPDATFHANNILIREFAREPAVRENIILKDYSANGERRVFARTLDIKEQTMHDVTVIYFKDNHRVQELFARRAIWENESWYLYDVHTLDFDENGEIKVESQSEVAVLPIGYDNQTFDIRARTPEEMSRADLWNEIDRMGERSKDRNRYMVMYHQKLAIPFSCFAFGLLGMPLGIRPQRTSPSVGFGISLFFAMLYFFAMSFFAAMGDKAVVTPLLAAWLPTGLLATAGLLQMIRAGRI